MTYHYDYDTSHRLIALTDSRANKTLTYAYSPGGLLNTLKDSDGNRTDYIYDPNGRMTGIWAPNDDLVSLNYDNGGRLIEKWLPNGEDSQYLYNADNTLQSLTNKRGTTVISSHVYTYDPLGNRQTQAETIGGTLLNYTYGYDPLNRLIQVQNGTAAQQENYSYDPIGNRLTKQVNATTPVVTAYVYDVANQLKEIHQGSVTGTLLASLTYDANGNMKTRSDTGLSLTYDALNRLTQATLAGQTSTYIYDALGRRLQKTVAGVATNYLYTGQNLVAEYGATWGLPTSQYVHGPGIDDVVIRTTSTTAQYYHQDGLNSVVAVTNTAGTTDATQRFDAWGNKIASTGTAPHFGYTGREPDETGLIFYRYRYYDPLLGRFTQRDPLELLVGINLFTYVNGNPIRRVDPFGLSQQDVDNIWGWIQNTYPEITISINNISGSSLLDYSSISSRTNGSGLNPGWGTIYIRESFITTENLSEIQRWELVNTLIHESLHQYLFDTIGYLEYYSDANEYHQWIKDKTLAIQTFYDSLNDVQLLNKDYQIVNDYPDLNSEPYCPKPNDPSKISDANGGFVIGGLPR